MEVRTKSLSHAERDIVKRYLSWLAGHLVDAIDSGQDVRLDERPITSSSGMRRATSYHIEVWLPEDTL